MCNIFEISEKESMNWVDIMMSDCKEELCSGVIAYKIPNDTLSEYVIYNSNLDKCIVLKTDSIYKLEYFTESYKMQVYLQSPSHLEDKVTYNLSKMTSKCKLFKLRKVGISIIDWILDVIDSRFDIEYIMVRIILIIIVVIPPIFLFLEFWFNGGI